MAALRETLTHRPEIDGPRAIAVVPVILIHAGLPWFSGSYVGVDVCIVISDNLITALLLVERQAGPFSLAGLSERRARRMLPML